MEGDRGGGRPGEKQAGGVQEEGEQGEGSRIPKEKAKKLCNIIQYFAIEKMQRGRSRQIQGGNRDYRVQEVGILNLPAPPPQ